MHSSVKWDGNFVENETRNSVEKISHDQTCSFHGWKMFCSGVGLWGSNTLFTGQRSWLRSGNYACFSLIRVLFSCKASMFCAKSCEILPLHSCYFSIHMWSFCCCLWISLLRSIRLLYSFKAEEPNWCRRSQWNALSTVKGRLLRLVVVVVVFMHCQIENSLRFIPHALSLTVARGVCTVLAWCHGRNTNKRQQHRVNVDVGLETEGRDDCRLYTQTS